MAILQSESLLNDATALLIYRAAMIAAAGSFVLSSAAPMLVLSALGSLVAGYVFARLTLLALHRIRDAATGTILQFVTTFLLAWMYSRFSTAKLDPLARKLDEEYIAGKRS